MAQRMTMRARWAAAWLLAAALPAWAALPSAVVKTEHVRAELVAHAPDGLVPGKPVWLGLRIEHQPEWHTYWKNPGDSGLPTVLTWQLPPNVEAGDIAWPTPQPIPFGPLMNYGYGDQLLLPVPVTLPPNWNAAALDVQLRADWLVCKNVCVPESGNFTLRVPSASATAAHAALFTDALARVPQSVPGAKASARVDGAALAVTVDGLPAALRGQDLKFLPELAGVIEPAAPIKQRWDGVRWSAAVPLSLQRSASPTQLQAVLVSSAPAGVYVDMKVDGPWPQPGAAPTVDPHAAAEAPALAAADAASGVSFAFSLLLALAGGLLLNLMPCVFPVLSLKVVHLTQPGTDARRRTLGGLAYTGGVIVSFLLLAGLLLALRAGGEQLGWGFQLQSPGFVAALALLFTLIGLNLAGVFEFRSVLPASWGALRAHHPLADDALTGALAVAVASPCTGPFMGVALGAALTQPPAQALAVFAALGLGMALPYLLLGLSPRLACWLPAPGPWMVRFKAVMAFPMFATVVWLVWVLGQQAGIDGATALLAAALALGFVAWALGSPGFGTRARWGFGGVAVLTLAATLSWTMSALNAAPAASAAVVDTSSAHAGSWQPWSPAAVDAARAAGRPVFVDYTAAWCVTCQFNKRSTLADPDVMADFAARNVLLLRADWTRRDPAITASLAALGRSGVPVYVLYPGGNAQPQLLPEILRRDTLRAALAPLPTAVPAASPALNTATPPAAGA